MLNEQAVKKDGIKFSVTRGMPPYMTGPEVSLNEAKSLYRERFGNNVKNKLSRKKASVSL